MLKGAALNIGQGSCARLGGCIILPCPDDDLYVHVYKNHQSYLVHPAAEVENEGAPGKGCCGLVGENDGGVVVDAKVDQRLVHHLRIVDEHQRRLGGNAQEIGSQDGGS